MRSVAVCVPGLPGVPAELGTEWGGTPHPVKRWLGPRLVGPELLTTVGPGAEWVLCSSNTGLLQLGSLSSGELFVLTRDSVAPSGTVDLSKALYGTNPRYLRSGHIAYFTGGGVLMVLPFDAVRRRVLGPPEPVLEGVRLEAPEGGSQLAVSEGGTLVYASGENARLSVLVWVDHVTGRVDTLPLPLRLRTVRAGRTCKRGQAFLPCLKCAHAAAQLRVSKTVPPSTPPGEH
jgi:hypothetical protein